MLPDPVLAKRLEEVGCATVMPLAAPIGTGRGLKLRDAIRIMIEQAEVPVVVDAGLGAPSHAAEAMEIGADAVLVNTAIARADDPVAMARAFRLAVEAGRAAQRAGIMAEQEPAVPSSPVGGHALSESASSTAASTRSSRARLSPRLLERLGLGGRFALVERNGEPVERARYGEVELADSGHGSSSPAPSPADRQLYLVTPARPDLADFLEAAVRGGVDLVQMRERALGDRELLKALERAVS